MFKRLVVLMTAIAAALSMTVFASASEATVSVPVVMYHHISESEKLWGDYVISPYELECDMRYLRENGYEPVTATELIAWSNGEFELPEKPVMITFDDGYESTYVYALPILQEYGMTATVAIIGSVTQEYTETEDHHLQYSHMNWEQVRDSYEQGSFDIQCHTWNMHHLSERTGCGMEKGESGEAYVRALTEDIETFQTKCSEITGRNASTLVLPYGFYTEETISAAKELGFKAVFTCTERVNHFSGAPDELFNVCRYNRPHGVSTESFFAKWG